MGKRVPIPIHQIRVASPCDADWDQMFGNEVVRHCQQCRLNVYNLSAMTRDEAERIVFEAEGRLCVRFYRRRDGTVLTRDCPVGLAAVRKRVRRLVSSAASAGLAFLTGIGASSLAHTLSARPAGRAGAWFERTVTMGDMVVSPPPPVVPGPEIGCMPVAQGIMEVPSPRDETPPRSHPRRAVRRR